MANIRKLYEADQTTQLMPQTHEKAVIDNNGTTAETKFGLLQEAYSALTQSDIVVVADHTAVVSPQANTIYREQGTTTYSDWMYYDSSWKKMATYDVSELDAEVVSYDNSQSALAAENVQGALDEIAGKEILDIAHGSTDDGFYVADTAKNVGLRYNNDGLDAGKLNPHFIRLLESEGVMGNRIVQAGEDGLYIVDGSLNIGVKVDNEGIQAKGLLKFLTINY